MFLSQYRAAARRVRKSEFGPEVIDNLRPRSFGLVRNRGPLIVQLKRADLEGRLVWRGADSFAVLQRPADRRVKGAGNLTLRVLDRHWHLAVLVAEFGAFLAVVTMLVLLRDVIGRAAALNGALIAQAVLILAITVDMVWSLLRSAWRGLRALVRGKPRPDRAAAEELPFEYWTMVLCHQAEPGDGLLTEVARRLRKIAQAETPLVCLRRGITTGPMRDKVSRWAGGLPWVLEDPEVAVRFTGGSNAPSRVVETGAFAIFYAAAVGLVVLAMSPVVVQWERAACQGAECAGRPVTYELAVRWLAQRLLWTDPPGISPGSFYSWSIGWMTSILTPTVALVAVAGIRRYRQYRSSVTKPVRDLMAAAGQRVTVLLVVATRVEFDAVLVEAGTAERTVDHHGHPVVRLGEVGGADVLLAQTGPASIGPLSSAAGISQLITEQKPDYLIAVGICFGMRPAEQRIGDVVVSRQLRLIDHRKVIGDPPVVWVRGDLVTASPKLYHRFAIAEWPAGVNVRPGTMLTTNTLVNSRPLHDDLVRLDPEAEGGEMEGAGIYTAAANSKTDWIIVKGISDYGYDKTDTDQPLAAGNAARLVLGVLRSGSLGD